MSKKDTCFIIPAYNEEKNIFYIAKNLKKIGDLIIVDDCSNDNTLNIIKRLNIKIIKHKKNLGYEKSLISGFKLAKINKYKYIITFDADRQHGFADAKKILNYLKKNYAIVYGKRTNLPRLAEKLYSYYTNFFFNISDTLCGLKGYNSNQCKKIGLFNDRIYLGSKILLEGKRNKLRMLEISIKIKQRRNESRFGGALKGNLKIFQMMFLIFIDNLKNLLFSKKNINY
tara:strand:+ start:5666 stop:6349 length:684 start_codon:yes stop_codon:yes gene_type:complete